MLIVGGASAFIAIAVFFLWRFFVTCRALWRRRRMRKVAREKSVERIAAE
jgi:hypothetical protein